MVSSKEQIDRHRARAWALQVHYLWEAGGRAGPVSDALGETVRTRRVSPRRLPHLRRIIAALDGHMADLDRRIAAVLENWSLARLPSIDRGVLRIGAAELLYVDDVPPKVAIQEGVRLAEEYGGNDSPRFVNGVLDALYREEREDPGAAGERGSRAP